MAVDVEKLLVSLEANLKQYEKEMARANAITVREMRKIERQSYNSVLNIERQMSSLGAGLKAGIAGGIAAAAAAFGVAIKSAISDAAKIGDVADKIGVTTDFLQELQYGAVQADLGFEELSGSLTRFSRQLGEAQNGQGDLLKLLEANGYSKAAVQAMSYADALRVVADLTRFAKNEQDQMQVATAAFGGKAGDAMIEFLSKGSDGLRQFGQDATDAGAKIDDALIRKAQEIDDRWAALMLSLKMQTQSAVLEIVNIFEKLTTPSTIKGGGKFGPGFLRSFGAGTPIPEKGAGSVGFSFTPSLPAPPPTKIVDPEAERERQRAAEEARRNRARAAAEALRQRQAELKAIEDVIGALEFENAQLGRNSLQQEISTQLRQAGVSASSEQGKAIAALVTENYNLAAAQEFQKEKQAEQLEAGQKNTEAFLEQQQAIRDAWMQLAEAGVNALEDIIFNGAKAKDVVKDLAKQLAAAALQGALLGKGPFGALFGTSGGGGIFGAIAGGFGGGVSAGIYHEGGRVGHGGPSRNVPAGIFAGAPRFHNGTLGAGLKAGEMPAILKKGEVVLPENMKLGGGKSVSVSFAPVIDARNADAPAISRLEQQMARMARDFEKNVKSIVTGEKARQPRFLEL